MVMDANRKIRATNSVINNLNIVMEMISRDLRTGYDYCDSNTGTSCDTDTSGSEGIYFKSNKNDCNISFVFDSDTGTINKNISGGASCPNINQNIVSQNIKIESLKFYISGTEATNEQPRSLIILKGSSKIGGETNYFELQTTVSQRRL